MASKTIRTTFFYQNSTRKRLINVGIGIFLMAMCLFRIYLIVPIFPARLSSLYFTPYLSNLTDKNRKIRSIPPLEDLFDRHAFRQISGLIDITTARHSDIIGQQLEWDGS